MTYVLGLGFRIRTDSVQGRIRVDSGGFRAAPQGKSLRYFTNCMGILTLKKWIRDSDDSVEGRIRVDSWTPESESANPAYVQGECSYIRAEEEVHM